MPSHAIYRPGHTNIQTSASARFEGGSLIADFTDETPADIYLARINSERDPATPAFILAPWLDVMGFLADAEEEAFVTPWVEITEEDFKEAIKILPPIRWCRIRGVEIFACCEPTTSNIHNHYAITDGRAFTRGCRTSVKTSELAEEILQLTAATA